MNANREVEEHLQNCLCECLCTCISCHAHWRQ